MADEVKQQPAATNTSGDSGATSSPSATPTSSAPTSTSSSSGPSPRPSGGYQGGGGGGYQRREGGSRPYAGSRPSSGPGAGGGGRDAGRKFFRRKKVCKFCVEKIDAINYKDVRLLGQFVAERGKIIPRRLSGVCTPHQRRVSAAIKQARNIALLPFSARG